MKALGLKLIIVIGLTQCTAIYTSEGGIRPKYSHFKLDKNGESFDKRSIIDTTCIYLNILPGYRRSAWFRFFSGGKFIYAERQYKKTQDFKDGNYTTEDTLALNDLHRGYIGYYEVIQDTILHLNIFYKTDFSAYYHLYAKLKEDKFKFYKTDGLPNGHFGQEYFKTSPDTISDFRQKTLKGVPDW